MGELFRDLAAILMQELYEKGLLSVDAIADKYGFNNEIYNAAQELYAECYGEE